MMLKLHKGVQSERCLPHSLDFCSLTRQPLLFSVLSHYFYERTNTSVLSTSTSRSPSVRHGLVARNRAARGRTAPPRDSASGRPAPPLPRARHGRPQGILPGHTHRNAATPQEAESLSHRNACLKPKDSTTPSKRCRPATEMLALSRALPGHYQLSDRGETGTRKFRLAFTSSSVRRVVPLHI